jgi:hypothetical protein
MSSSVEEPFFQISVEGIPPRETIVTFSAQFASYFPGEVAAFTDDEAAALFDRGVIGAPPPPVNVVVPQVSQAANVLSCTMGEWNGTPTSYAYQWRLDGTNIGTNAPTYNRQPADIGASATCVVTATNAFGSTAAPPSNAVVVT